MNISLARVFLLSLICFPGIALAGYDLHITRASEWTMSAKHPISKVEWKTIVASDRQLQMDTVAKAKIPQTGEIVRVSNPLMASWVDPISKEKHYFNYTRGKITVKNPSKSAIVKMKTIASKLSARVQGDEGEWY